MSVIWSRAKIKDTTPQDLKEEKNFWSFIRSHENLRTLLIKYARHKPSCTYGKNLADRSCEICTCGLNSEIERLI